MPVAVAAPRGARGGRGPPDRLVPPSLPPPSDNCTIKIVELLYVSIGI